MADDLGGDVPARKITQRDWVESIENWRVWTTIPSDTMASLASHDFMIFFLVVMKVGRKLNLQY